MRLLSVLLATCFAASGILAGTTEARPKDSLQVKPDTFIDTAGAFGDQVDPGAASSQWVNKSGTTSTSELFGDPADFGLVLAKNFDNIDSRGRLGGDQRPRRQEGEPQHRVRLQLSG